MVIEVTEVAEEIGEETGQTNVFEENGEVKGVKEGEGEAQEEV